MMKPASLDPFVLLKELEHFEHESLHTQDPVRKFVLLQNRSEVLELLVAMMTVTGLRCERLDRVIATEPAVRELLETYTNYLTDESS